MERVLTVEFGPSRSKRFAKAVAEAQSGGGECSELEPGSYRVRFVLGSGGSVYTSLARLLQRVRNWRATEVYEGDQLVSSYHAREMGWCASFYLSSFGECRDRFGFGVLPRCGLCPLFDSERAIPSRNPGRASAPRALRGGLPPGRLRAPRQTGLHDRDRPRLPLQPRLAEAAELEHPRLDGPEPARPRLPARRMASDRW